MAQNSTSAAEAVTLRTEDGGIEVATLTAADAEQFAEAIQAAAEDEALHVFLEPWVEATDTPQKVSNLIQNVADQGGYSFAIWLVKPGGRTLIGAWEYVPSYDYGGQPWAGEYESTAWVAEAFRGQHVAARAGALITCYMFDAVQASRLEGMIHNQNTASRRLAERLGRTCLDISGVSSGYQCYAITRAQYLKNIGLFDELCR